MKVNFLNEKCGVEFHRYSDNDRIAIQLLCEDGLPMATATVNMPDIHLESNQVCIKDYSENTGILKALIDSGIVEETGEIVQSGFVQVPICNVVCDMQMP